MQKSSATRGPAKPAMVRKFCFCQIALYRHTAFSIGDSLGALFLPKGFLDQSLHYLAARVAHRIGRRYYHRHLKTRGIKAAEWWVLSLLEERDDLTVSTIASHIFYDQPTTGRLLDRMERQGLIIRRPSPADRRKTLVDITRAGKRRVTKLQLLAIEDEREATRSFKKTELENLKAALRLVLKDLGMEQTIDSPDS